MRSVPRTLLFRSHFEAAELWRRFVRVFPEVLALCLMPDHVHLLLPHADPSFRRSKVASAYARWRNRHRQQKKGPAFAASSPGEHVPDADHARRTVRYVHLNPCRAKLTNDPLLWPWTTHRDQVGFGVAFKPYLDPIEQHRYVSADPTCHPSGTALPATQWSGVSLDHAEHAVRQLLRRFEGQLSPLGTRLLVQTAGFHGAREGLHQRVDVGRRQVYRLLADGPAHGAEIGDSLLSSCVIAAGDPRFGSLVPLSMSPGFQGFCARRGLR